MNRNLKQMRIDSGLTQLDVSKRLGVSIQTIHQWERGRSTISRKHWSKLAALLKVNMDDLEAGFVQTLLDACMEQGNTKALNNAIVSGLYSQNLLQDALTRFMVYPSKPAQTSAFSPKEMELREEILRLREENLKLREQLLEIRERAANSHLDNIK